MFSARTNRQTAGTSASSNRMRSRRARSAYPRRRTGGSTQTCWSCTALGVHADASALKRITPPSSQIHERPSSICTRVRQRNPFGSRRRGSTPSSSKCAFAHAGTRTSRSPRVAGRSPVSPASGGAVETKTGCPSRSSRGLPSLRRASSHSALTAPCSPISMRGPARAAISAKAPHPWPDGTTLVPR